MIVHKHVR